MKEPAQKYDGKLSIDNSDVARVFERIADLLEFRDENLFKVRSYRLASETIADMQGSVAETAARGGAAELQKIPGIGKSISAQILEITQTGTSSYLEELRQETPETVLDLRRVSGIGLKTAQTLYRDFGIRNLEELKAFAEGGGLMSVQGLGEKTISRIEKSLARIESERGLMRLNDALDFARAIVNRLAENSDERAAPKPRVEIVGQARRGREMVDAVEVLTTGEPEATAGRFASLPQIVEVKSIRSDRVEAVTKSGAAAIVRIASDKNFPAAMVRATGSPEHLRDLEAEAAARGLVFKGFDLYKGDGKKKAKAESIELRDEEEFYRALGLDFIPPELREGGGEIIAAREGRLPALISLDDIRGDFHMHTTWSDGRNSVREMIEAARDFGFDYIAITDHTKSSSVANGNTPEELLQEIEEIAAAAREFDDIKVFKGAEVDILSDGSLDMPFEVLDRLDWIVCSIHSGFHQEKRQITDRVIRAMQTGYPNVFAHPTGRILGERPPYEIDLEQVIAAAKENNVRLELNASPYRLDLDSYWLAAAKQAGVGTVISTDSHQSKGFANMYFGVATARRAWLTRDDVLNTRPLPELIAELEKKKASRKSNG